MIQEPICVQVVKFLIEKLDAKLTGQKRHVLDDGESHAPLRILG